MLLRLISVIIVLLFAFFIPVFILHVKDVVKWRWRLIRELRTLKREQKLFRSPKKKALAIIEKKCLYLFKTSSTDMSDFSDLPEYIISIAGCFHIGAERPELKASLGQILYSLERSLEQFDTILLRPGFTELASINIKTIKKLRNLYNKAWSKTPSEKKYLYSNLTTLLCSKYLIVDLYIFLGRLAVDIYDKKPLSITADTKESLEATLTELSRVKNMRENDTSEELLKIKNNLVGMPAIVTSDPTVTKWKQALKEAALYISQKHFPESDAPMDEAMIGPLLMRTQSWINSIGKGEGYPITGQLLKLKLETIFLTKNISDTLLPSAVKKIIMRTQKAYGWVKWPLNVYMWASKGAFVKIALDVGWFTGRKAILALIFGKSFSKACNELEIVYQQSTEKNR